MIVQELSSLGRGLRSPSALVLYNFNKPSRTDMVVTPHIQVVLQDLVSKFPKCTYMCQHVSPDDLSRP